MRAIWTSRSRASTKYLMAWAIPAIEK
jgi:hypothetical protein